MQRPSTVICSLAVAALAAAGCGGGQTVSVSAPPTTGATAESGATTTPTVGVGEAETPAPTPTPVPGTRPTDAEVEPDLGLDVDRLLLAAADLPDSDIEGPLDIDGAPTWDVEDCDMLPDVFAAHEQPGRGIQTSVGDAIVRQVAVTMDDEATASSVLDAADLLWERCTQITTSTDGAWWIEPLEMPKVDGWRTNGVALGSEAGLVWTIGWYQQGPVVVIADLVAERPWDTRSQVDRAIAARLVGDSDPVRPIPELVPAPTPTVAPVPTPRVDPTPTPRGTAWQEHPASVYLPSPDVFGVGWRLELDRINEAEPSDPDDAIEGCDVDPPPTLAGLEMSYEPPQVSTESSDSFVDVEVLVGIDDRDAAVAALNAFRVLADCDPEALDGLKIVPVTDDGDADDRVAFEWDDFGFDGSEIPQLGRVLVARYDDVVLAIAWAASGADHVDAVPPMDDLAELLDDMAAQGG